MPKGSPRQMGGRPYFAAGYKFFMLFFMVLTRLFPECGAARIDG
jgi:hypothetical protein